MTRHPPATRAQFRWFNAITTRWMDNDAYGHVNNVVYYSWIDTAVNRWLLDHDLLDVTGSEVVGIVAETACRYISQIAYPDGVTVGIRVAKLGRSSVRYDIGIFRADDDRASAEAHFVHVYVDRATMRPVPIPDAARAAMEGIVAPA
jgi:acyl-CoA thioester hydrolase